MAHTKSLTTSHFDKETGEEVVESVVENRVTGFLVHAMIGGSLGFLGVLRRVPVPIVSGGERRGFRGVIDFASFGHSLRSLDDASNPSALRRCFPVFGEEAC